MQKVINCIMATLIGTVIGCSISLGLCTLISGCTENQKAKGYGGKAFINIEPNRKVINVTWKQDNLWYTTRPMHADEIADTIIFHEKSSFGVWEGTYKLIETKGGAK